MSGLSRAYKLLVDGGPRGLFRGVRDWLFYSEYASYLVPLWGERELKIRDTKVRFGIYDRESFRRSLGHGEQQVISDFLSVLDSSDVVWDVGANQGTYSLFASKIGATAYGFEPNPSACQIISENERRNCVDIKIQEYALGAESGESVLHSADRSGKRRISEGGEGTTVPVRRGDELDLPEPSVLKIDVEGGELDVIVGLGDILNSVRVCYVEWHDENRDLVYEKLRAAGFELTPLSGNILKGVRAEVSEDNETES